MASSEDPPNDKTVDEEKPFKVTKDTPETLTHSRPG
jgi:hypothetical protein